MNNLIFITGLSATLLLLSCGQSTKEKQLEQSLSTLTHYQDSVKQDRVRKAAESKLKWAREQANKNIEADKQNLVIAKTKLCAAEQELNNVAGFHLLRSASKKQAQIQAQALEVQKIQDTIDAINNRIELDGGNLSVWTPNSNYQTIYVDGVYIGSTQGAGISNGVTTFVNPGISHTINGNTMSPFPSDKKMQYEVQ